MEFDFTDEQYSFRDAARGLLGDALSATALRGIWAEGFDYDHRVWARLADLGVAGTLIPEALGGFDGDLVDLVLVLEAAGAQAVPEPLVETAVIAPLLLRAYAPEELAGSWLPRIASGDALVAVAPHATASVVPDGLAADAVIVLHDDGVHWVERDRISGRRLRGADPSRRLAECTFQVDASTRVSDDPAARTLVEAAGAMGTAALLVGLAEHLVYVTRDYVLQRRQFDRVIGEFQSIKHRLADALVQTEAARSLAWNAGYRLAAGHDTAMLDARTAKAAANRAAHAANAAALQLHGGIGFTWEHDLHLWLQRGKAWERSFGTVVEHRSRVGSQRLGVA